MTQLEEKITSFLKEGRVKGFTFTSAEVSFEANRVLNRDYYQHKKNDAPRFIHDIHGISVIMNPRIEGVSAVFNYITPFRKQCKAKRISFE